MPAKRPARSKRSTRSKPKNNSHGDIEIPGFLSREELSRRLRLSVRTLDRLNTARTGPPRIEITSGTGRRHGLVAYKLEHVAAWLSARAVTPQPLNRPRLRRAR